MFENRYKRNILFRSRNINNRNIIFGSNQCYELNELAELIWNNIDGEKTVEELIQMIADGYVVPKEVVREDVRSFLEEMTLNNVILECK